MEKNQHESDDCFACDATNDTVIILPTGQPFLTFNAHLGTN